LKVDMAIRYLNLGLVIAF